MPPSYSNLIALEIAVVSSIGGAAIAGIIVGIVVALVVCGAAAYKGYAFQ